MGDGIFKDELSRRDAMKTAMKAGAYAAPVILAASVPGMGVAAATPGPGGPTITGVNPPGGPTTGGTGVTLTGTNFCPGATVTVNGVAAIGVTVVNATTITFTTPPGTVGAGTITVTCPLGQGTGTFTYHAITATAEAYTANASVLGVLNVSKVGDVTLPPGGSNSAVAVNSPGILVLTGGANSAQNISNTTPGSVTARSNATVATTSLLAGALTATVLSAQSTSTSNGITASSTAAFSGVVTIGAATFDLATVGANFTVPVAIPGVTSVVLNRVTPTPPNAAGGNSSQTATAVFVTLAGVPPLTGTTTLEIATAISGVAST